MPSATNQSLVSHLRGPEALCSPPCICLPFTLLTLTHLVSLDPLPWEAPLVRYITGVWNHHIPPHEGRGHSAHSPQPKGWGNLLGGHLKAAGQDSKAREETAVRSRVLEQTSVGWTFPESWAPLKARSVKNPPAVQETWVRYLGWEDPPEKGRATHSRILAWRIELYSIVFHCIVHGVAKSQTQLSDFPSLP